jgi:hypothetical protein
MASYRPWAAYVLQIANGRDWLLPLQKEKKFQGAFLATYRSVQSRQAGAFTFDHTPFQVFNHEE